jgi:hypothetical protein
MPIALRGAAVVPAGNPTTSFTVVIPSQVLTDDVLFISVTSRDSTGAGTLSVTDNDTGGNTWTKIGNSTDHKATLWYKRATSATASKTITVANAVGSCSGVLKCFSGASGLTTPYSDVAVETNASGDETCAGFTPANPDSMVCHSIYNYGNDNAVTSHTSANLGALTTTEKLSTGGLDCACAFGHVLQSGGPSATGDFTWAQTNGTTYSIHWAIITSSYTQSISGALTPTGALQNRDDKAVSGTLAPSGVAIQSVTNLLTATLGMAGGLASQVLKAGVRKWIARRGMWWGPPPHIESSTGPLTQLLTGAITPTSSTTELVFKAAVGAITPAGSLIKAASHSLVGTLASAGALVKDVAKAVSGSITPTWSLVKQSSKPVSGSTGLSGTIAKSASQQAAGTVSSAGGPSKAVSKGLAGAIGLAGILTTVKVVLQTLTGSITPVGSTVKNAAKAVAGALGLGGTLPRSTTHNTTGAIGSSGATGQAVSQQASGTLGLAGTISNIKVVLLTIAGSLGLTGSTAHSVAKLVVGALPSTGSISNSVAQQVSGAIAFTGSVSKSVVKWLAGVLGLSGTFSSSAGEQNPTIRSNVNTLDSVGTVDYTLQATSYMYDLEDAGTTDYTLGRD